MITCNRSYDAIAIYNVIDECFEDITEDDTSKSAINFSVECECWLKFELDDELLGFMQLKPYNRTTLDIHPYILSKYRRYSKQCGILSLEWFDNNAPIMYQKLISQVPSCYRHIKNYTLSLGFELEGTHKKAFRKGGKLLDLWLFGRERKSSDNN